jgi:drug/metabolite transporter (DMT)-like permease
VNPRTHLDAQAAGLLTVFCAIWGVQQVAIKVALAGLSPLMQSSLRSLGALILVLAWTLLRRVPLWRSDGTLAGGLLAGLLFSSEFALLYGALTFTTASRGVIFLYTAPFFVALGAAWLLPHERPRRAQWMGLGLAFFGVLALFGENLLRPAGTAWIGDLMMLGAAMLWAATTLTIKASRLATAAPEKTLLYQLAVSVVLLPLTAIALGQTNSLDAGRLTATVLTSLAFQIVVVATFSYLGWFWLIRHYPATRLAAFSFLTPVFGVMAGGLLLNEPMTPAIWLALGLVGGGIFIANRPPKSS